MPRKGKISYINRDYDSIREALVRNIPLMTDRWTDRNESDIGMVLLELFSGVADMLSFYLDVQANQSFLPTATQRAAVINLCRLIDYYLSEGAPSSVSLLFVRNPAMNFSNVVTVTTTDIISESTSEFEIVNDPFIYEEFKDGDVVFLDNGYESEFHSIKSRINNRIVINGVTLFSYPAGSLVKRIDGSYTVDIKEVSCTTSGAVRIPFVTTKDNVYYIEPGKVYVNEAYVLSVDREARVLTITNPVAYVNGDNIFVQSRTSDNLNYVLTVSRVEGNQLILADPIPPWVRKQDIVARLVPAFQGELVEEIVGRSNGFAGQRFELSQSPVILDSIKVYVDEGTGWKEWYRVNHFFSSDSNDRHFVTIVSHTRTTYIEFGDNINGKIPDAGSNIKVVYYKGGGTKGNVGAGSIVSISSAVKDRGDRLVALSVINPQEARGGEDPETIEVAKKLAPFSLRAQNRCVNIKDYEAKTLDYIDSEYGRVALARAVEIDCDNSVIVYVWGRDYHNMPSRVSNELINRVRDRLINLAVVTMNVVVKNGDIIPVDIEGKVYIYSDYSPVRALEEINKAIDSLFYVENIDIGKDFNLGDLYEVIENLKFVDHADITKPERPGVKVHPTGVFTRGNVKITVEKVKYM